jgi:membrane protein implicated in regulation of membrane protease activity
MPKLTLGVAAWISVVVILVIFELLQLSGILRVSQIAANFYLFMFSLVTVSILAVIGAIFLGITIAHRFIENREFTPFEEEMLSMKEQINRMEKMIESMLKQK